MNSTCPFCRTTADLETLVRDLDTIYREELHRYGSETIYARGVAGELAAVFPDWVRRATCPAGHVCAADLEDAPMVTLRRAA